MNTAQAPQWLPSFLIPFVTLSYPVDPPAAPDSFKDSSYYAAGLLDFCTIVTIIAVMAVLRDAFRLGVFEPFAKWYLTRQLQLTKGKEKGKKHLNGNGKANGTANGTTNGHAVHDHSSVITKKEAKQLKRSVIRFAEQGWPVVYYSLQWVYGLVRHHVFMFLGELSKSFIVRASQRSNQGHGSCRRLDKLPPYTPCWSYQVLLFNPKCLLHTPNSGPQRRGTSKGPLANDDPPRHYRSPYARQLLLQLHACRCPYHDADGLM